MVRSLHFKKIWSIVLLLFFALNHVSAQSSFSKHSYRVSDGLPTDLVKSVGKDTLGYLWIASDEGLARFDGRTFTHYPGALPSQYAKGIHTTKTGSLFVLSDFGLTEVEVGYDTIIFHQLLKGARAANDSSLNYPKTFYETKSGEIWITEPNSLVWYNQGQIKRYFFDAKFASDSFVRSYSLFEIENELWAFSINGGLFYLDTELDDFVEVELFNEIDDVEDVQVLPSNEVLVACDAGLFVVKIDKQEPGLQRILPEIINAGQMHVDNEHFIVASENNLLHSIDTIQGELKPHLIDRTYIITQIFEDDDEIWLSSEEGLGLLRVNDFNTIGNLPLSTGTNPNIFVESVVTLKNQVYFCFKEGLLKYDKSTRKSTMVLSSPDEYFLSISNYENELWVSSEERVYKLIDDKLVNSFDNQGRGDFIFNLESDFDGNIWFTQDQLDGISKISRDGQIKVYGARDGLFGRMSVVRTNLDGEVYTGGSTSEGYLYKYIKEKDRFENLSHSLNIDDTKEFDVFDIRVGGDNDFWLGTSVGLVHHTSDEASIVSIDDRFKSLTVKAVEILEGVIYFSNSYGIVRYNPQDGSYFIMDESNGLPSKDVSKRSIKAQADGTIWVGTSKGLSFSNFSESNRNTIKPFIQKIAVNGQAIALHQDIYEFKFNPFIEIEANTLDFPGELVDYRYQVDDESWIYVGSGGQMKLSGLLPGSHELKVVSRNRSGFDWSEPAIFKFSVNNPWYLQTWSLIAVAMLTLGLVLAGFSISAGYSRKQKQILRQKVDEQTKELLSTNTKLTRINKELDMFVYSASHDLRAPLSSVLGLTSLLKLEISPHERDDVIAKIEQSIAKLDEFIQDVIDYSKNSRMKIELSTFDPVELANGIFNGMKFNESAKSIHFEVNIQGAETICTDKKRLQILLNNLISNAVRYSDKYKDKPYVKVNFDVKPEEFVLYVEDNGIGIAEEHQSEIFGMFYRANESSKGSGLGLYIVYEIIQSLKGSVQLISKEGEGTGFIVKIPNHPNEDNTSLASGHASDSPPRKS